jgi:hypothetical protein
MTTATLLLADPPIGKFSTICKQHMQRSMRAFCHQHLTKHNYYFVVKRKCEFSLIMAERDKVNMNQSIK